MKKVPVVIAAVVMSMTMSACEVEKTQEGELPEISAEGGQMPEYNVETPDVEIGTERREVSVPTVDIDTPNDSD